LNDEYLVNRINGMVVKVKGIYTEVERFTSTFFNENKDLDRKSYAIKGQAELPKLYFSLAMNLYLGKETDYKAFMSKHYKDFGIMDDPEEEVQVD
jgi:hypothetical protein